MSLEIPIMKEELTALEAKNEAQKLAFAPIIFQTVIAMQQLGILEFISRHRKGVKVNEIATSLNVSLYGVCTLCEAAACANIVEYLDGDTVKLGKIGFFFNSDTMTKVNLNFVNDVCYNGAKFLVDSIKSGKPEGLKTIGGNWSTLYEGLSQFPEPARTSWLDFDHYYSDNAFDAALQIVFKNKPEYLFDIGGNTGKWSFACCNYDDNVRVKILDLQGQLNIAKKNADEKGFLDRIDFHAINLLDEKSVIPTGADAIWMSQFLDCFSQEEIISILKKVYLASSETTAIYILEPFIDNQKYEAAAYCLTATSLYFTFIANGNSKMYPVKVMQSLIADAGFKVVETYPLIGDSQQTLLKCMKA